MPKTKGHPSLTVLALGHPCIRSWDHYDVRMSVMSSRITNLTIVYSSVYSGADQRKHQSSSSLAFVREIHRWPVNSAHRGPVTRKMFPFDDVIMSTDRPRHHGGCRAADARSSVTTMPTLQLWNNCTTVVNNVGEVSASWQTVSFFIAGGLVFFQWWCPLWVKRTTQAMPLWWL